MRVLLNIVYWIGIFVAGVLALKYAIAPVSYVVLGIAAVGLAISIFKSVKSDDYLKGTLALNKSRNIPVYDFIRVFAVISVITIHVLSLDLVFAAGYENTLYYKTLDFIVWWCLNCNIIFVMLSGALLLPYKDETVLTFYGKRLSKIVIPLIVYYLWYSWAFGQITGAASLPNVFKKLATADFSDNATDHFWLVYVLIAVYILIAFLRPMLKNYPYKFLTGLVIATVLILTFFTYVPFNIEMDGIYLGWVLVAVVGFWCAKDETRKYDTVLIIIGILSSILMWVIYRFDSSYGLTLSNLSPYRLLVAMGVFAFFFKINDKLKSLYLIRLISKYSYGIMLVHYWVVGYLEMKIGINSSTRWTGAYPLLSIIVALILSLIVAYLIDNFVCVIFTAAIDLLKKK